MLTNIKKVTNVIRSRPTHWVGDGFPVRQMISPGDAPGGTSPFLLLDYAGPHDFPPSNTRRGVGEHPHRGFETVTLAYQGQVDHRDSAGHAGSIKPGDVQWMTAASGVVHEEFHGLDYARQGGTFEMVQLWVNLPAAHKMDEPRYQALAKETIPVVELGASATLRVIAGAAFGKQGPAQTFTPINLWDLTLEAGGEAKLTLPQQSNTLLLVRSGVLRVNDTDSVAAAELAHFEHSGTEIHLASDEGAEALLLNGQPIDEPVVSHGPFVMNSDEEIRQAIRDYENGQMGRLEPAWPGSP
ncbi:MAG: pirin family protein [Planctomycetes bacterium]|nr:pirin family protein [Planctomycetota bacterium]